jgi:TonB family protein
MKTETRIPVAAMIVVLATLLLAVTVLAGDKQEKPPGPKDFVVVDVYPEMIKETQPVYPEEAKKAEIEGDVWVRSLIDKDGNVVKAEVAKPSGTNLLDESALAAATKNKFKPASQDGKPVAIWITYKVSFVLDCK